MIVSSTIGGFFLWLLCRNTDWKTVYFAIQKSNTAWLLLAQIFAWSSYWARAQRWSYVVRASHPASFRHLFSATQIGYLFNFTIPARMGEVIRAYVLAELEKIPLPQTIAMVALDRVSDIFGMLIILFVAVLSFPITQDITFKPDVFNTTDSIVVSASLLQTVSAILTLLLFIISGLLVLLYFKKNQVFHLIDRLISPLSQVLSKRLHNLFLNFAEGMHVFQSHIGMLKSAGFSLITWGADLLSVTAILNAFSINYPWYTSFLMLSMISAFIAFPILPGVVGQYHLPVIACLLMIIPDINTDLTKAVAIVSHALTLIPIAVLGTFSLFRERINFFEIAQKCYQKE